MSTYLVSYPYLGGLGRGGMVAASLGRSGTRWRMPPKYDLGYAAVWLGGSVGDV